MDLFQVLLDNPTDCYSPNSIVSGSVILKSGVSLRNLKIGYLGVRCQGVVRTGWSKKKCFLLTVKLQESSNTFPFDFLLPSGCPPSFVTSFGSVSYSIHVELDKGFQLNERATKEFQVSSKLELNDFPNLMTPVAIRKQSRVLEIHSWKLKVSIPKQGFYPGEIVPITINFKHHSRNSEYLVEAKLIQHSHYTAFKCNCDRHCDHKTSRITVVEKWGIMNDGDEMELLLKIPELLVASFNATIFQLDYSIDVKVKNRNDEVIVETPVVVGGRVLGVEVRPPRYESCLRPPPRYSEIEPSAPDMEME